MLLSLILSAMIMVQTPIKAPSQLEWSMFPGDGAHGFETQPVHDPTIVQIGGRSFCFCTSGNGFTFVRSSKDLLHWQTLGPILPKQPEWLAKRYSHQSIWAPDVVVLRDRVRVYYCASNFGTNKSVIGLAECERFDPERPLEGWVDKGLVYETKPGDPINAIDPEVIVAEDGRHWMYFGSYWSGIHVTELDPKTGMLRNADRPNPICVAKNLIEQGDPIEGAAVLQRNGFYYLFVSYGLAAQGVRSSYRIMVGRSKSPTGPFEDQNGKAMSDGGYVSVLKTSPPMMSPGHCDVLKLNDGRYVMPYHFYDARRIWHGDTWGLPTLQIRELLWSSDDWPLPGLPIEFERAKTEKSVIGTWTHQVDFGQPSVVELTADGKATNDRNHGTWTLKGDELVVSWPRQDAPGRFWLDKLKVAYGNTYYVGRNDAGLIIRGVRVPKGG